ncbi:MULTISPECIES: hypothetical protein [unclassified Microbacterium]|uniref:hypothetical protein n=1 Tax=unclassified Microbacterium TaxID=2609290 RepID=UPI000CFBFCDE|nr:MULTISPECIES: hypothetical protein [unclassified Microbacterium]PQZ54765.1 hypothetical protein CQ032_12655 [Microbacterium sp. MYb43]PQZ77544.1 hypothetical protein CQ031_11545 [Microbacterium sp. MYb40]PRB19813.1 hypothetical protein CQ040_14485 [Microbacterium sp. MYb54]PRB25816.1 hypothetical protein CQ037_13835 [Microbacterium sp. MYb50]PRB64309.1 hypothetical protein CQ021_14265 [Microbacterium sp. MYb24]
MTTETLTIVISAIGIVLTLGTSLFAAGAWMVRRIDDRIDAVDEKLSTRIDAVDEKLSSRIDAVAADVTDLKNSVARLEGPPRHLLTASR